MANPSDAAKKAWKTRRIAGTIETKRNSGNDLRFTVKSGGQMLGTLQMGRGSAQWFAPMAKNPTGKWT
jgi:hypothetical protein